MKNLKSISRISHSGFGPIWTSRDGTPQYISSMAAEHVFYAARMLYNHTVTPAFRVIGSDEHFHFYQDVKDMHASNKRADYDVLVTELLRRFDELPEFLQRQYTDMKENRAFLRRALGELPASVG